MQKSYHKKHIIIAGSARSGTSWLAETMAKTFRYRLLFEPDHPIQVPKAKVLADTFVPDTLETPKEMGRYFTRVLNNTIDSNWIAQNSNRAYKMHLWPLLPKKYILKLIRSNLALHSLQETFHVPVIHIVRNPYDVIASQHRVQFPWLYNLSIFANQPELVKLVAYKTGLDITAAHWSSVERLALRWGIENVVPIQWQKQSEMKRELVYFETLKDNIEAFQDLCSRFQIATPKNIAAIYNKPSSKTHPKSSVRTGKKPISVLTQDEKAKIKSILAQFHLEFYEL